MLEDIQLSIKKIGRQEITLGPGSFLTFHDKEPGADNINLMIKIFSSVAFSLCFPLAKFYWILISDG